MGIALRCLCKEYAPTLASKMEAVHDAHKRKATAEELVESCYKAWRLTRKVGKKREVIDDSSGGSMTALLAKIKSLEAQMIFLKKGPSSGKRACFSCGSEDHLAFACPKKGSATAITVESRTMLRKTAG